MARLEKTKVKDSVLICTIVPVICCIIFGTLCLLNISSSIWFDESYSAYLVRGSFGDIWNMTSLDVHPPVFYFLLKIWASIFGYTDYSMRFMSVFFGALTLIFLFQLLKRWFGLKSATITTFLTAISPIFIRYGQEMRMYTLVFFIVVLATYVLDLALDTKKTRYYILYGILISLGMWTHYFTAIAWIAHIIYYKATRRGKIFSKQMLLSYILAVLLFVPWMPSLFRQVLEVESGFWIPSISLLTPVDYLSGALIYSEAEYATGWLVLLVLAVVIFTTFFLKKQFPKFSKVEKSKFWLLISLVALPPAILIILSLPPLTSMFVDRYILYSAALLYTLVGLAISYAFTKRLASPKSPKITTILPSALLLVGAIGCAITGIVNVENRQSEGYAKDTVLAVQAMSESQVPILINNEWNYYDAVFYSSDEHPIYGVDSWIDYQYGSIFPIQHIGYNLIKDENEFIAEHPTIWYVTDLNDDTRTFQLDQPILKENYHIISSFADDHLVAFELQRN